MCWYGRVTLSSLLASNTQPNPRLGIPNLENRHLLYLFGRNSPGNLHRFIGSRRILVSNKPALHFYVFQIGFYKQHPLVKSLVHANSRTETCCSWIGNEDICKSVKIGVELGRECTNAIKNFKSLAHAVSPQANATAESKAASKTKSLLGVGLSDCSIRLFPLHSSILIHICTLFPFLYLKSIRHSWKQPIIGASPTLCHICLP
ncbi:hypothetical protein BDP27DRAFT_898233 [Rhodocollybia butyracea]|uniref:Uncharacterized protein n=1 Tax=Rhodocollybia butyracea TaxID=206335 RepID=A0A9P5Q1C4_9AGAR|nr:hypothetical protein BDP27DRAFT_898233 [Rhodocollybia butyracea]